MSVATGKPMTLRARWNGEHPAIGDYLRGDGPRVRSAYQITHIRERTSVLELDVVCIAAGKVPEGAVVHPWKWDPRSARNGAAWHRG